MPIPSTFRTAVYDLVRQIPKGRVMTYGQVAAFLGYPRAAQYVGWCLHWADMSKVPCQRVVNRFGRLAAGYTTGGQIAHKHDLLCEGIKVRKDYTIDLDKYIWHPDKKILPKLSAQTRQLIRRIPFA